MGASISVLVDELVEVTIKKPEAYTGSDVGEQKIYELELTQYVKDKAKLEGEIKKLYSVVLGQC